MSGGVLVVVDRSGRAARRFPLSHGLATVGRDPDNDIRITLPAVAPHHATVLIHDAQAVIRSTGGGLTLVNGRAVSVAPLRHGDVIEVGGRALRWEYSRPRAAPPRMPSPVEPPPAPRRGRGRGRRSAPGAPAPRDRAVQLALEMAHRASMPGSTGGKQVAIVQPQRRDAGDNEKSPARASPATTRRSHYEPSTSGETEDKSKRKPSTRTSPKNVLQNTTKATLWIESRKTTPRRKVQTPAQLPPSRRSLPSKKSTPLRMAVLKKAQSAHKNRVIKIEAPTKIDHTKQAAIMLMTGHTPKSKLLLDAKNKSSTKKSPSYLVKKPSPVRKTPRGNSGRLSRGSKSTVSDIGVTPSRGSERKSSKRYTSVSILEITDSTQNSTRTSRSTFSETPHKSLPSPKKSAMKDRSKKSSRKTESIKFDLSNLESHKGSDAAGTDTTRYDSDESDDITLRYSESSAHSQSPSPRRSIHSRSGRMLERVGTALTSPASPSRTLASPSRTLASPSRTSSSNSPLARRSLRGNAMVQSALENASASARSRSNLSVSTVDSDKTRSDFSEILAIDRTRSRLSDRASDRTRSDLSATLAADRPRSRQSANSIASVRTRSDLCSTLAVDRPRSRQSANSIASDRTRSDLSANDSDRTGSRASANPSLASAFRTRTISPRHNLESYSVVDLISFDSEDATKSVYDSADEFGSPGASARRARSAAAALRPALGSSTPYAGRGRPTRSESGSAPTRSTKSGVSTRRSKSLTTPENGQPVTVPRVPRPSRSRSRIHDDLSLLDALEGDDSPRTSRRSRTNASETIDISNVDFGFRSEIEGTITPENRKSPEMEGTPVLSIRSLLESSRASVASAGRARARAPGAAAARRSRLRLSRSPGAGAGAERAGLVTPPSAARPSPEAVRNKHSTAKKPHSKRSIIDDLDRSDIVKQLFDSPVKRKLTQSMSEFSRKRLFDEEDEGPARRPTRRTIATAGPADTGAGGDSRRAPRNRKSVKNDLTDVRGVKALFARAPIDDLRRVTGVGALLRKTSPGNDLSDVRGVRKMFQKKSPANDLRNVSGVKRVLASSPRNDLTDVRGVRRMFKGNKRKTSYRDVSGIEELFQSRNQSADTSEEMFDMMVGRPPIRNVYSRTFPGRAAQRSKARRGSLQASGDFGLVEEWLDTEFPSKLPPATARRVTAELKKLATDTSRSPKPILPLRTRNKSLKSGRVGPGAPPHSTPLKGRLQLTMNASELGRVSPIAVPASQDYPIIDRDCFVFLSDKTMDAVKNAVRARARSPRKQKSPKKVEISKPKEKTPEKPTGRNTRKKAAEIVATNTRRRRASLVVTKKAPVMSPKAPPKDATADSQASPKAGTSRTRGRAIKAALVVAKPSPKLKTRRGAKAVESSQTEQAAPTVTRRVTRKKLQSPKMSAKGNRNTRADASKIEPQTKTRKTKVELAPVKSAPQSKRTRRTNAVESIVEETSNIQNSVIQTRRGKAAAPKPEVEKKQPNSRAKKTQNQTISKTVIEPEVEEKRTHTRGKKIQTQTSSQSATEEKKSNTRVKKVQFEASVEIEPTTRRGRKTKQEENKPKSPRNTAQSSPSEQPQPAARGRRAKAEVTIIETRRGKRKAATDLSDNVPEPKKGKTTQTPAKSSKQKAVSKDDKVETNKQESAKSTRATRAKAVEEPATVETKRARGRKAIEPKEKPADSTRGKRKANVDPSPAKAAAKKAAPEAAAAPRARRAARTKLSPEAPTKAARGRRR